LYQVNVGQADSFAGYEVVENPHMASTGTAGELALAFGHIPSSRCVWLADWTGLLGGLRLQRQLGDLSCADASRW